VADYCDELIKRDPATKQITRIINTETNAGGENTSGVDIGVRYLLPTAVAGRFQLNLDASWLRKLDIIQADGTVVKARGNYDLSSQGNGGQGGVIPAWKFNAGMFWGLGGVTAGVNMRFIGSWHECGDSNGDFLGSGVCSTDSTYTRQVDAWTNWDLFVGYALKTAAGKTNIGLGVQNVFDTAPAKVYNGFTAASDPTAYDFMGRYFYLRLTQSI
jgi:iron complex outermembrane receptor protein